MPTILQINVSGNRGSTGTIAEAIGILALERDWESYIAYGRFLRSSKSKLIPIGSKLSIFLHGLQTRLFDRHGLGSVFATKKLIKQIKSLQPNVIHLHNIHGYYINVKILFDFLKTANIPVVWTLHDCWSFTGHCAHFDFIRCQKWKTFCEHCPQKKEYPSSLLFDRSKKNFLQKKLLFTSVKNMTIVPVSYWLESLVKESFLANVHTHVIQNGIDVNVFMPQSVATKKDTKNKLGIVEKRIVLGVASPWSKRKGLEDFIKLSEIIDKDIAIVLVGLNQKQISSLPNNIIGWGRTENRQQLVNLYSAADVFVNPTWEDNFPTTNLEALACGTPVITYNTGGSIESISAKTGLIVERGNVVGLNNAINEMKQKGKHFFSGNCREEAVKNYDKKRCFANYFDLYKTQ